MRDLRAQEARLRPPQDRNNQLSMALEAASRIMSLGTEWAELYAPHHQTLRRRQVYDLLEPGGLIFDPLSRQIVGIRPREGFFLVFQTMLEQHGWTEYDRVLWKQDRELLPTTLRKNRFTQIMELIKTGPITSVELCARLGMKRSNVGEVTRRMVELGLVKGEPVPGKKHYRYAWVGGDSLPKEALRNWEDRQGRYRVS